MATFDIESVTVAIANRLDGASADLIVENLSTSGIPIRGNRVLVYFDSADFGVATTPSIQPYTATWSIVLRVPGLNVAGQTKAANFVRDITQRMLGFDPNDDAGVDDLSLSPLALGSIDHVDEDVAEAWIYVLSFQATGAITKSFVS